MASEAPFLAARTPRTLWVELTSKCPFDCVFCSRKTRRGSGVHLPFEVYSALLGGLIDPRKFILNYSGESTVYPDLIPAIQRARATGAFVELVSVFATAPESLLEPLSRSGLNRLTVSVHATDPEKFAEVYRYGSFETLRARLERFLDLCRTAPDPPVVDLAFVAMDTNLPELLSVASLAARLGLRDIMVFPVARRDEIPAHFDVELEANGSHTPAFQASVRAAVAESERTGVRITVCNENFTMPAARLGEVPIPWPWALPPGALIHACEQNPWETAHVLSNGDVVACEVLDKVPLGNLHHQSIVEIWHGEPYRRFREQYRLGQVPQCRTCPWKRAYLPGSLSNEILAARGLSAQLLYGWQEQPEPDHIWSSQQSAAVLAPRAGASTLHVSGLLPPGPGDQPNDLTIHLDNREIGRVTNPWREMMPFGLDFPAAGARGPWLIEFRTRHIYRPSERGVGPDQRDLGFALVLLAANRSADPASVAEAKKCLEPLREFVKGVDRWAGRLRKPWHGAPLEPANWTPGLSVVIPEWDNREELAECLAAIRCSEPLQVIVVVNGSPPSAYDKLRNKYPSLIWCFYPRPLGFSSAIGAGLKFARHDWVYLLNSDVVLAPSALDTVALHRSPGVLSVASQILLQDTTRFRDETNWTTMLLESGLATVHDRIPLSEAPAPNFYAGGGASLFRTRLLRKLIDSAYDPFYWEDVEWGWRARKLGLSSCFCAASIARHTRRSTIGRHYAPEAIDNITRRNRLLFQLRNFTTAGSLERVIEEIAQSPDLESYFLSPRTRWKIARGRLWSHLAPLSDEQVFAQWNSSISNF